MENAIKEYISTLDFDFDADLIQNTEPITFAEAQERPLVILRWRFRECSLCEESFDIHYEGRFYQCGSCLI
jgi:hypothetical protein